MIVGLGLAGGGHGWGGPFFFSMILIVLYPVAFVRAFDAKVKSSDIDAVLLGVAGLLDSFLLMSFFGEAKYVASIWSSDGGPLFISLWLAFWAGWQILIVVSLLRRKAGKGGAEKTWS